MTVPVLMLDSKKKAALDAGFYETFTGLPERYFSAPGRTEISGNHTDHQGGCVLAGAVNLDTLAAVRLNGTNTIRVHSKGYPLCEVCLEEFKNGIETVLGEGSCYVLSIRPQGGVEMEVEG